MVRMYRSGDMTSIATQFKLWLYHNALCVSSADSRLRLSGKRIYQNRSNQRIVELWLTLDATASIEPGFGHVGMLSLLQHAPARA